VSPGVGGEVRHADEHEVQEVCGGTLHGPVEASAAPAPERDRVLQRARQPAAQERCRRGFRVWTFFLIMKRTWFSLDSRDGLTSGRRPVRGYNMMETCHHHQPINFPTAGAQAFLMDYT
jgi:hypothetical protein